MLFLTRRLSYESETMEISKSSEFERDTSKESRECSLRRVRSIVEREIVDSYYMYRGLACRSLRSFDEAEEVIQTFALKAIERTEQLRDVRAVRGWLRRIFQTTLIDYCRQRSGRKRREVPFDDQLHDKPVETTASDVVDPAGVVIKLLPRLKPEYADIVHRIDLLDRSRSQTADELGISVNNLTVRLHRARAAVRTQLTFAGCADIRRTEIPLDAIAA